MCRENTHWSPFNTLCHTRTAIAHSLCTLQQHNKFYRVKSRKKWETVSPDSRLAVASFSIEKIVKPLLCVLSFHFASIQSRRSTLFCMWLLPVSCIPFCPHFRQTTQVQLAWNEREETDFSVDENHSPPLTASQTIWWFIRAPFPSISSQEVIRWTNSPSIEEWRGEKSYPCPNSRTRIMSQPQYDCLHFVLSFDSIERVRDLRTSRISFHSIDGWRRWRGSSGYWLGEMRKKKVLPLNEQLREPFLCTKQHFYQLVDSLLSPFLLSCFITFFSHSWPLLPIIRHPLTLYQARIRFSQLNPLRWEKTREERNLRTISLPVCLILFSSLLLTDNDILDGRRDVT